MENPIIWPKMDDWIRGALDEDIGSGDVTTEAVVDPSTWSRMAWFAKSDVTFCGGFVAWRVFELLDPRCRLLIAADEGQTFEPGAMLLEVEGPARALLAGERLALNVCQRLCGIAGQTRAYVNAVKGTRAKVAATRKTSPYLRRLEKYAVKTGGGVPHRFGLDDGILIKDNHIAIAGSITEAVSRARANAHHLLRIEVEVTDLDQAFEAIEAGAELLLLDNMDTETMERAVHLARGKAITEASGNVTIETIKAVAETGVDLISSGALTHSVIAADISARITSAARK